MEVVTRRVLETSNDVVMTGELNINKVNEFVESVNDDSTVDEVERERTYIEIDQIRKRRIEEEKYMLEEIIGIITSGEKCYYGWLIQKS